MNRQVIRIGHSSTFHSDFYQREQQAIESLPGMNYFPHIPDVIADVPTILLSHSQTNFAELPEKIWKHTVHLIHANSGHDNFPKTWNESPPCPITLGHEIRTQAVTEFYLSCLFHHFTTPPRSEKWLNPRTWKRKLIQDLSILIVGAGHIGQKCLHVLTALGAEVVTYDPFIKKESQTFQNIVQNKDVIILAASLNPSSQYMFKQPIFDVLVDQVVILNAARGSHIIEKDLIYFLKSHPHAFAYIDVFENEPHDFKSFSDIQNISVSSHIAGVFGHLEQAIIDFEMQTIKKLFYPNQELLAE